MAAADGFLTLPAKVMLMDVIRLFVRVVIALLAWAGGVVFALGKWALKQLYRGVRRLVLGRAVSHGSARFASLWDLARTGSWGGSSGIIVGKAWGRFIRFKRDGAVLCVAPMGKGKGVGIVVPALLDHVGAVVVTDPKGENFAVTGRFRGTLGPVYRLDAINPQQSDRFNPLSLIRVGTLHEADDAAQIADLLVIPESKDSHWDTSSKNLLQAVIRHVINTQPPELCTLAMVREEIAADGPRLEALFRTMAASRLPSVAEEARAMLASFDSNEAKSVIKNAAKALAFWSKDRIGGRLTASSDFDFLDLHRGTISVFIMVPDDALSVYAPFLRVMMGCAVAALMRGKHLPRPAHKPMLMIDECAALGRLDALEKAVGLLREYAHLVMIWQDLGQLQATYGERARTFMAAAGAQVTFGVSDIHTARDLADSIGRTTVLSHSDGASEGHLDLLPRSFSAGRSETGRFLLDPAEIRRLPADRCLIFLQDQVAAPIRAGKVRYYQERCWRGRWDRWRGPPTILPFPVPPPAGHGRDDDGRFRAA